MCMSGNFGPTESRTEVGVAQGSPRGRTCSSSFNSNSNSISVYILRCLAGGHFCGGGRVMQVLKTIDGDAVIDLLAWYSLEQVL